MNCWLNYVKGFPLFLAIGVAIAAPAGSAGNPHRVGAQDTNGLRLPILFEPNVGRADRSVQFSARSPRSALHIMAGGESILSIPNGSLRMSLARGAKPAGVGVEPLSSRIHYLVGSNPDAWHTNIATYGAIRFENVYPGINLVYHGAGQLEYDFVVAPGADPSVIALEFSGADRMDLDAAGDLTFSLGSETLRHRKPRIYQIWGGVRHEISGQYVLRGARRVQFEISEWNRTLPLIIDPVLSYGTFLGGAGNDGAFSVAVDPAGNMYLAGITTSSTFLATGSSPVRGFSGVSDAFIAKLNPQGTAISYLTYLGGSDQDTAMAIAVDAQGNAYLTGGTSSRDFPLTSAAFQPRFGGAGGSSLPPFTMPSGDGFVTKLNPAGTLAYSSYLGGSDKDQGYGIAVDASGAVFVAGATSSQDFPVTSGVLQPARKGSTDSFVARVSPDGSRLLYATYLGGSGENFGTALALDSSGNAYVAGITASPDFPATQGAFQSRFNGRVAAFVAKLNSTGTGLAYATYLGGDNTTYAYGLAVDSTGSAYVTGGTNATNFPVTPGAFQRRAKSIGQGGDAYVARLAPAGNALMFSSVFGGNGPDFGRAITLDASGDVYIAGSTGPYGNGRILDFPTTADATQRCGAGNPTGFLTRLSMDGTVLKYSSYLGSQSDGATSLTAIAVGAQGKIYVAGSTTAADFPASSGAVQTTFAGPKGSFDSTNLYAFAGDALLAQVDLAAKPPMTLACAADAASFAPNLISPGEIVSMFGSGIGPQEGVAAALDSTGRLPTTLANTRVLFDGVPAPLLFVRSDQINAVTPFALAGKSALQVQVEYANAKSPPITVRVTGGAPGIFTTDNSGSGQAAALNQDNSVNAPSNPAHPGSIVSLFATGAGPLDPIPADGAVVQGTLTRTLPASAYVGSCPAEVLYSGSAPGLIAGAIQVNVRIPLQAPPPAPVGVPCGVGDVPIIVLFGNAPSQQTVTISLR